MIARTRGWWTDSPMQLHLDNSNIAARGSSRHIPDRSLLLTALGRIRSLIVEHTIADLHLLRSLHRQQFFPELEKLVLSTPGSESWGPLPRVFDDEFNDGVPVIDAPRLHTLHLRSAVIDLPSTHRLSDVRLNARARGSRNRPRVWNKWPVVMIHSLLARNDTLTVLHLAETVRTEAMGDDLPVIRLSSLEVLVVCSPSTKEPIWVLETLDFPESTYMGLHIGHKALRMFEKDDFYNTLSEQYALALYVHLIDRYTAGVHLKRRTFHHLTAVSSLNLSGVLLSPATRPASALPRFDETDSPLHTTEIAHTFYREAPGAVDIFISYQSPWVPEVGDFSVRLYSSFVRTYSYRGARRRHGMAYTPTYTLTSTKVICIASKCVAHRDVDEHAELTGFSRSIQSLDLYWITR